MIDKGLSSMPAQVGYQDSNVELDSSVRIALAVGAHGGQLGLVQHMAGDLVVLVEANIEVVAATEPGQEAAALVHDCIHSA